VGLARPWPSPSASCRWWSGVEAAGEIAAIGAGVTSLKPGDRVVGYGGLTCGTCKACREGRE